MKSKKPTMTKEEAAKLYQELRKNITQRFGAVPKNPEEAAAMMAGQNVAKAKAAAEAKAAPQTEGSLAALAAALQARRPTVSAGTRNAITLIATLACLRVGLSATEHLGIFVDTPAQASVTASVYNPQPVVQIANNQYSPEEIKVLTALDKRRSELEERNDRLDQRESDLGAREQEMMARLQEVKSLTERLKVDRQQDDRKRDAQLEQLSKVYSSMNPEEAAKLMQQLDITIALTLLERMPDKRIGQILALMTPERALQLTQMMTK